MVSDPRDQHLIRGFLYEGIPMFIPSFPTQKQQAKCGAYIDK